MTGIEREYLRHYLKGYLMMLEEARNGRNIHAVGNLKAVLTTWLELLNKEDTTTEMLDKIYAKLPNVMPKVRQICREHAALAARTSRHDGD